MNYSDALAWLYGTQTFGIKLGLHVEESLLQRLGNPERHVAVIHVAGTNGKGSVCALLESILRQSKCCRSFQNTEYLMLMLPLLRLQTLSCTMVARRV